jgi:hypothetical protein
MKSKIQLALTALALATLSTLTQAQSTTAICQATEEELANVSVKIAEAYSSADFDKAKEYATQANAQVDRGVKAAIECGCDGITEKSQLFKLAMTEAMEENDFALLQDKLADALNKAEAIRVVAETCWHNATQKSEIDAQQQTIAKAVEQ